MATHSLTAPALLLTGGEKTSRPTAAALPHWVLGGQKVRLAQENTRSALSVVLALSLHLAAALWFFQQAAPQPQPPRPIDVSLAVSAPPKPAEQAAAPALSPPAAPPPKEAKKPEKKALPKTPPKLVREKKPEKEIPKRVLEPEARSGPMPDETDASAAPKARESMPAPPRMSTTSRPAAPRYTPPSRGPSGPSEGDATSRPIVRPSPQYPPMAIRRGWTGSVSVQIEVFGEGKITAVRVIRSSGYDLLDQAALSTVRQQWRFSKCFRGGRPASCSMTQSVSFRIPASTQDEDQ